MSRVAPVLVLGTGASIQGVVASLQNTNLDFFIVGNNRSDYMVETVGQGLWINIDYSKNKNSLSDLIRKYGVQSVIPGCNDAAYRMCLDLATDFSLLGIDDRVTGETITFKDQFSESAPAGGLTIPETACGTAEAMLGGSKLNDLVGGPVIIKPVDSHSGLGTRVYSTQDALKQDLERVSQPQKRFVVQRFIEGHHFSVSVFLHNKMVSHYFSASEFVSDAYGGRWIERSIAPSLLDVGTIEEAVSSLQNFAQYLGLCDGLLHGQFVHQERLGKSYCFEVMRRLPGDLFGYHFGDGAPYHDLYIKPYLSELADQKGAEPTGRQTLSTQSLRQIHTQSNAASQAEYRASSTSSCNAVSVFPLTDCEKQGIGFNNKTFISFQVC